LEPEVDEAEGMKEILNKKLGPEDPLEWDSKNDWTIGECLSTWWRPNYENYMVNTFCLLNTIITTFISQYPYVPAHVTSPKEKKSLYIVHLPPNSKSV
jgi:cleavage and polyadenylation specificity factor subunit 5